MNSVRDRYRSIESTAYRFMEEYGVTVLRYGLALIFIWFGALKLVGMSPASDLVAATLWFLPAAYVIPAFGIWEIFIGLCFAYRPATRVAILLLAPQIMGTFLPLLMFPAETFQGPVYALTMEGQFIVKNILIIGAAMVVGATHHATVDAPDPA